MYPRWNETLNRATFMLTLAALGPNHWCVGHSRDLVDGPSAKRLMWQRSSVVEQGNHNPLVGGSNPSAATHSVQIGATRGDIEVSDAPASIDHPASHQIQLRKAADQPPCL